MASSARIDELRKKFDENPRRYFAPLANEYRKSGDLQQAVFICQEYLPQQPGHMSGHIVFGQALFEMGRAEEANVVFETALSLDPENLIALRHLGDIARQRGDLTAARIWYQRVLEADPRNEEIAQLMISLLAIPEAPPRAPAVHTPPLGREPVSREPLRPAASTPMNVPVSEFAPPAAARSSQGTADESFVVEKSESATELASPPPPAPAAAAAPAAPAVGADVPPPPPHTTASTQAGDGHAFLSLDDFNLGGSPESVPTSSPMANPAPSVAPDDEPATQPPDDTGFDLGTEDGPFEIDPYAVAAGPVDAPSALAGLETFEPGAFDAAPVVSESLEREEFFEPAAMDAAPGGVVPTADSAPEPEPEPVAEPAEPEPVAAHSEPDEEPVPQAFVTETMAELYLRQDHLDAALDIYRQLVDQRPNDLLLRERLRVVEQRVHDAAEASAAEAAANAPPVPVYGGPTIREFLSGLAAGRRTLYSQAEEHPEPSYEAATESEPEPSRPSSNDSVSGSIDALFSSADASAADAAAAATLQEAFATDGADAAPLHGVPAHTASSELSLDHVFKGNAPPPPDADGFSFDQFFAEEMSETVQHATKEGAAPAQPVDDIAQFNAWLNGLKKT